MLLRTVASPVALFAGLLMLTACGSGESGSAAGSSDPNAGFDAQIPAWRTDIEATNAACATKNNGKGCEGFEVTCKGAMPLTPEDTAKGVTAKVVAAMRFAATSADGSTGKPAMAYAEFSKAGGQWTRVETAPLNPTTCAAL